MLPGAGDGVFGVLVGLQDTGGPMLLGSVPSASAEQSLSWWSSPGRFQPPKWAGRGFACAERDLTGFCQSFLLLSTFSALIRACFCSGCFLLLPCPQQCWDFPVPLSMVAGGVGWEGRGMWSCLHTPACRSGQHKGKKKPAELRNTLLRELVGSPS